MKCGPFLRILKILKLYLKPLFCWRHELLSHVGMKKNIPDSVRSQVDFERAQARNPELQQFMAPELHQDQSDQNSEFHGSLIVHHVH